MAHLLSFDPGYTTGYAVAQYEPGSSDFNLLSAGELEWAERHEQLFKLIGLYAKEELTAIIVERFVLYPNKAMDQTYSDFPSVQVIGAINAFSYLLGVEDKIQLQTAAQRKPVKILPEHEQALKHSRHARDAYRHLRYYAVMSAHKAKS